MNPNDPNEATENVDDAWEVDPDEIITITDDDNKDHPCIILGMVEHEGSDFVILAPIDQLMGDSADNTMETFIFGYVEDEEGEIELTFIEDDATYQTICDFWAKLMVEGDEDEAS